MKQARRARSGAQAAKLSHLDARGRARMVDVGAKPETQRLAIAEAVVVMRPETLALIQSGSGKKGEVLSTARIAALAALKRTSQLIPLCHPVRVVGSDVTLEADPSLPGVRAVVEVHAFDRTGVEMEALVGAAVAALTIYDMVKSAERGVTIGPLRLLEKRGGRTGSWRTAAGVAKPGRLR
jgi:cyclic pyranopterin phosphate synthase